VPCGFPLATAPEQHGRGSYILLKKEKRGRRRSPYRDDASIYPAYCVSMVTWLVPSMF